MQLIRGYLEFWATVLESGDWVINSSNVSRVMSLLEDPNGYLSNLSSVAEKNADGTISLNYVLQDDISAESFVRLSNPNDSQTTVTVTAQDDGGEPAAAAIEILLEPQATLNFNSGDMENGNSNKFVSGAFGDGIGSWRLSVSSSQPIQAMSLFRTPLGFVNSIHSSIRNYEQNEHEVVFFNPGGNRNQVSSLRIINSSETSNQIYVSGIDDNGEVPGTTVPIALEGEQSTEISAADLETLGLEDGAGKWRLSISSAEDSEVQSLLTAPGDYQSNLSTFLSLRSIEEQVENVNLAFLNTADLEDGFLEEGAEVTVTIANDSDSIFLSVSSLFC